MKRIIASNEMLGGRFCVIAVEDDGQGRTGDKVKKSYAILNGSTLAIHGQFPNKATLETEIIRLEESFAEQVRQENLAKRAAQETEVASDEETGNGKES